MREQNPFIWHELVTLDQKSRGAFFSQLFRWTRKEVEAGPFGIYTLFQENDQDVAEMMNPTPDAPGKGSHWHSYIAVDDVEKCAKQAPILGGRVVVPAHDVPDVGRICVVADPDIDTADVHVLFKPFNELLDNDVRRSPRNLALSISLAAWVA